MPASIAIASTAMAISASNSAQLHRLECESVVNYFQSNNATVSEMQKYADCIKYLHPDNINLSSGSVLYIKLTIVITIFAMIYAMYLASKDEYDKLLAFIVFPFAAFIGVPIVMGVLALCYMGMSWVIS